MQDIAVKALEGGYDIHLHAKPCVQARRRTMLQIAHDFSEAGMKGFVVKDHDFPTAQAASIVNEAQSEVKMVGGITVSKSVGGLNPAAVETTFRLGGRVFWMSALESGWMYDRINSPEFKNSKIYEKMGVDTSVGGYRTTVSVDSDELREETKEIIGLCKKYGAVYETSHSSKREAYACLKEANAQGMKKFVVTHANVDVTPYTFAEQKELVARGATIMLIMAAYMGKANEPGEDIAGLAENIREVGAKNIVLATDFGLSIWPSAAEGMHMMVAALLGMDVPEEDIRLMVKENAERLYFD